MFTEMIAFLIFFIIMVIVAGTDLEDMIEKEEDDKEDK